ncbi:hypothetical protein EJ08DRAFT_455653 [Tothia fuscella]|uniref:DUF7730 domain-containing protein n=1 Tax=Tothia fuscella TaxID=1048955 RepID=A0A9P4TUZ4_9PEZI|nr:hypothetical protein EJ08DRAFT_455653 [Tothia fuscella]
MAKGFLDLPTEVSLKIYRCCSGHGRDGPVPFGYKKETTSQLLRTCTQVYYEAIDILYGENTFLISASPYKSTTGALSIENHYMLDRLPLTRIKHVMFRNYDEISRRTVFSTLRYFSNPKTICLLDWVCCADKEEIGTAAIQSTLAKCGSNVPASYSAVAF